MNPRKLIFAVLIGCSIAAGLFVSMKSRVPVEPQAAFIIPIPTELPEFALLDQFGNAVNADTFRGQWDLVFFGFTHCPDICPATLQILASVNRELIDSGSTSVPRIVLVSVDPERDTPDVLGKYMGYFGADSLGITGELEEIQKLTAALGIYFSKVATDDDNYVVDHSAVVLAINPDGEFYALFSTPHEIANYVHDLPLLMARN